MSSYYTFLDTNRHIDLLHAVCQGEIDEVLVQGASFGCLRWIGVSFLPSPQ